MRITKPLDNILNTEVKTRILRFLCRTGAEWNGRQIAKEIGASPKAAHAALNALNKEGVLLMQNVGKTHIYSLNHSSFLVSSLLKPLFAKEGKALDDIIKTIKKDVSRSSFRNEIVSIALFGSVNLRKEKPTSDIDLAVIISNSKIKAKTEKLFEKIDRKVSKEFGNTLSPYINTKREFKSKHKRHLPVIKNILNSYSLILGKRLESIL